MNKRKFECKPVRKKKIGMHKAQGTKASGAKSCSTSFSDNREESLNTTEREFLQSYREAMTGDTFPIEELWDDIDDEQDDVSCGSTLYC